MTDSFLDAAADLIALAFADPRLARTLVSNEFGRSIADRLEVVVEIRTRRLEEAPA
jgi:hypothetical protein